MATSKLLALAADLCMLVVVGTPKDTLRDNHKKIHTQRHTQRQPSKDTHSETQDCTLRRAEDAAAA